MLQCNIGVLYRTDRPQAEALPGRDSRSLAPRIDVRRRIRAPDTRHHLGKTIMSRRQRHHLEAQDQGPASLAHRMPKFEIPRFDMPKFDMPKMEVPAAFREFAEKGVNQAKDNWEKMKAATEEATDLIEDSYATASKGAADYGLKLIEAARANTNAAFDFASRADDCEVAVGGGRAVHRAYAQAVRRADRADQGTHARWLRRSRPRPPSRSRRASPARSRRSPDDLNGPTWT